MTSWEDGTESRQTGLAHVASGRRLLGVWQDELRKRLRKPSLRSFEFAHDPQEWASIEWRVDHLTALIAARAKAGTYRGTPAEIVRSAKGGGLTRPLAGLFALDTLLFRSIVRSIESQIMTATRPWELEQDDDEEGEPTSDWFHLWLVKDAERRKVIASAPFVVVTDVANFYPYVSLQRLEDALRGTSLDGDTTALLMQLLRDTGTLYRYRSSPAGGLPQENYRCSELLAHLYLRPLDDEFAVEGSKGRYWRYSDDVVIAVDSREEGEVAVGRFQRTLEPLGLYPAGAKTKVTPSRTYLKELYLDLIEEVARLRDRFVRTGVIDRQGFVSLIQSHLSHEPKGAGWMRAMRRLISLARHIDDECFLSLWEPLLTDYPGTARWVADYLAIFPMTTARATRIIEVADRAALICDDIPLLLYEVLASAPNDDDVELRDTLSLTLMPRIEQHAVDRPRLAAAAVVPLGKHGTPEAVEALAGFVEVIAPVGSPVVDQAATVLLATHHWSLADLRTHPESPSSALAGQRLFLQNILSGEYTAVRSALAILQPSERRMPAWNFIRPRALFLAPLIHRVKPVGWISTQRQILRMLDENSARRRDAAAARWVSGATDPPPVSPF